RRGRCRGRGRLRGRRSRRREAVADDPGRQVRRSLRNCRIGWRLVDAVDALDDRVDVVNTDHVEVEARRFHGGDGLAQPGGQRLPCSLDGGWHLLISLGDELLDALDRGLDSGGRRVRRRVVDQGGGEELLQLRL